MFRVSIISKTILIIKNNSNNKKLSGDQFLETLSDNEKSIFVTLGNMSALNLQKWDQEMENPSSDKNKLHDQIKAEHTKDDNNPEFLYRLAKVLLFLSKIDEKNNLKDRQKQKSMEALGHSEKACKLAPNNAECHKWYCASVGSMATLTSNNKEKIKYGQEFKQHADIALKLSPNDPLMLFMYGRWCYEVASLSWLEKKLAKAIYGTVPTAEYSEALDVLKKAAQFKAKWIECHLWIAKTLLAMKQKCEAKKWIDSGLAITPRDASEEIALNDLKKLQCK